MEVDLGDFARTVESSQRPLWVDTRRSAHDCPPADGGRIEKLLTRDTIRPFGKLMTQILRIMLVCTASLGLFACTSGGDKFVKAFASPDNDYVAVLVSEAGGAPGANYCIDTVLVVPREILASGVYPAGDRAYVGGCHSLNMTQLNGRAIMPSAPRIRWTGPHQLNIAYNPTFARQGVAALLNKTSLHSGKITITYEEQEPPRRAR